MAKSNPRRAPSDVEEEVFRRLPWWRRELLRIVEKVRTETQNQEPSKAEDESDA